MLLLFVLVRLHFFLSRWWSQLAEVRSIIEAYESGALGKNKEFNYFKFVALTLRRQSNVTDFKN